MGVFDTAAKVRRAVVDPLTDRKLPPPSSLSWGAITTPAALGGTKGAHCELVHGDHWREIRGNATENIQLDSSTTVTGNHGHSVSGNQNLSVLGTATDTHLGPCTKTYVDNKVETYGKHRFTSMSGNSDFQYYNAQFSGFGFELQVSLVDVEIYGFYITVVTNPLLAAIRDAGIASGVPSSDVRTSGGSESQEVGGGVAGTAGVAGAAGVAGVAAGWPTALQLTLNSGMNISVNFINWDNNELVKLTASTFYTDMKAIGGKIEAAAVKVGAFAAGVAAQLGVPAHVPLFGSPP